MDIQLSGTTHYDLVRVIGDVDASSSLELDNTLDRLLKNPSPKHIIVDCTALQYISSPGIGVFTSRLDESDEKSVKIVLFGLNDKVAKVFRILGLDSLMTIVPSLEEAKRQL